MFDMNEKRAFIAGYMTAWRDMAKTAATVGDYLSAVGRDCVVRVVEDMTGELVVEAVLGDLFDVERVDILNREVVAVPEDRSPEIVELVVER